MMNPIKPGPETKGYLALVLHAHLPYVRHYDRDDYMEERWFYEAMTETYLPLIETFDRLLNDGVHFRITLSVTPTLLALCTDKLMQERYEQHLESLIKLADKETVRLKADKTFLPLAEMYARRFRELKATYLACGRSISAKLKQLQDLGCVEVMTSAATHGFLPLMKNEESIRAQIATAVTDYERHFGRPPRGIWLPECAYTGGIDRILKSYGIRYFFVDSAAVQYATPKPNRELYAPLMTPYGVTAFPRDTESSKQVWSAQEGYPGDFNYREYYRDIGWDLGWNDLKEWEHIRPHVLPTHNRVNTGIKYFRITGNGSRKEPYNPQWAMEKASEHAGNFLYNRQLQATHWDYWLDRKPIIVSPYDAELYGHWWYEGPAFIEYLFKKIYFDQTVIQMITPSEYLEVYPIADTGQLAASSWGRGSSYEVWLQGNNDWIYRHLHQAEDRMIRLATAHLQLSSTSSAAASLIKRALNQAARELMLAQSSDWAFIMDSQTVVDYACRRTKDHLGCFSTLCGQIENERIDESFLRELEEKDNCFPLIDYRSYGAIHQYAPIPILNSREEWEQLIEETRDKTNVFMLAWEYPPKNVGGLSRAVCDLSEALAARGETVHVITTSHYGAPYFEKRGGVYVHRLPVLCSYDTDFYHWTFEMNLSMTDYLVRWKENGGRIDLLHAHDWMVQHTAREIKQSFGIPLVATIHATEWGRNQGTLYNQVQRNIHDLEWQLTYEASKLFVCSHYMKKEVESIFNLPSDKTIVFPNCMNLEKREQPAMDSAAVAGIRAQYAAPHEKIIFYIGRLVYEKGIQTLIHAMPRILAQAPDTRLIIAGSGPMQEELQRLAGHLGDHVRFAGFVDNELREALYRSADVCVFPSLYEPFGIVVLESMGHRKPVVVSDVGGLAEIVEHGVDGYKALPGHVESLAWHITELLLQPELGQKLAQKAFEKLGSEYTWDKVASGVQDVYHRLTFTRPPDAPALHQSSVTALKEKAGYAPIQTGV